MLLDQKRYIITSLRAVQAGNTHRIVKRDPLLII